MNRLLIFILLLSIVVAMPVMAQGDDENRPDPLGGATTFASLDTPTDVRIMLDWTSNTNHSGIYVAQARGYYADANLNVEIIEPTDFFPEGALDAGLVEFGIGFQDFSTPAMASGNRIVSIAAIIQNNTSAFVTIADDRTLESPADIAGLQYVGFGFPDLENAILQAFLACDDATWDDDNYLDVLVDPIELLSRQRADVAWIFAGWAGINAQVDGIDLSSLMLADYQDCIPNYYTPILLTSRDMIEDQPDVVRAFVHATARGYAVAISSPDEAADVLLESVPELDEDLVRTSAAYLAEEYQAGAARWGQQDAATWQDFTTFLIDNGIIDAFDPDGFWTNEFLPGTVNE